MVQWGQGRAMKRERGRDQLLLDSNVITSNKRKINLNRTKQRPNTKDISKVAIKCLTKRMRGKVVD